MHRPQGDSALCYNVLYTGTYRNTTNTTWLQPKEPYLNSHCVRDGGGRGKGVWNQKLESY